MVKYRQGIAIIDTADPILFRFLPPADNGDVVVPPQRAITEARTLAEAVEGMDEIKKAKKLQSQPDEPTDVTPQICPAEGPPNGTNKQETTKSKKRRIAFRDLSRVKE
jgi:hypothetical protein